MWATHTGDVVKIHHISRAHYHRAIREVLKDYNKITMERMADDIANRINRIKDLWKDTQKIKGCINVKPGSVDEHFFSFFFFISIYCTFIGLALKHVIVSICIDICNKNLKKINSIS